MSRRGREFPLEGIIYRSNYERTQAKRLIEAGVPFEYETVQMDFFEDVVGGECADCGSKHTVKNRKYTPDFWLKDTNIFVETKGLFDAKSRTKMKNVITQSDQDIRMCFMRDNFVTRKHKMTYGRWCDINGIEYAVGNIPEAWYK